MNHWARETGLQPETCQQGQLDYFWIYIPPSSPVISLSDLLAHFYLMMLFWNRLDFWLTVQLQLEKQKAALIVEETVQQYALVNGSSGTVK